MGSRVCLKHAPIVRNLWVEKLRSHRAMRVWATTLLWGKIMEFSREPDVVEEGRAHLRLASSVSEAFLKPTPTSCGNKDKVSFR